MSSKEEPKIVRKNDDASCIKEWVSDDEEEDVSQPKIEKKIVRPSIVKKYFVKSKQHEKTTRKTVKQVEQHRQNTHNHVYLLGLYDAWRVNTAKLSADFYKTLLLLRKNPQMDLQDQGVIDSGCLRHMTGNMSYLTNYEEIDGGYVAFGGNPKGGKITGKEAVNTACYVKNRVLVVKPHNKNPYELFHGRTPTISFMRPFGCPVTILNTIDHLGKFDGKADEGFFIGYSLNSKAFRVFNSRTRIVEENLHIRFSESTPNVVGSGLDWLFDIDALTRIMNYEPIIAGTQSNDFTTDLPFSQNPKSSHDDGSKPSSDDGKKVDEDPRKENDGAVADMNNLDTTIQEEPKKVLNGFSGIKRDERGIMIRSKARLVAQGYTQEEGIDYDEVFAPVARIKAIRLFLAYASFKDFVVFPNGGKVFLYGKICEEGCYTYINPPGYVDSNILIEYITVEKKYCMDYIKALRAGMKPCKHYMLDNGVSMREINKTLFIQKATKGLLGCRCARYTCKPKSFTSSCCEKDFRSINREAQLHALVDGKKIIVTESSVRRDLQLADDEGVECLSNSTIFEQLALMGVYVQRLLH
ncbi:retrovirus-related pol polyprotein from transposon TNT 1-94 [Tanacetum coccineum]